MTPEEQRAFRALDHVSMRLGSSGKRFRREVDRESKLTKRQAMYLWFLCDMYRRQIKDEEVLRHAQYRRLTGELPLIYLEGDHRELAPRKKKERKRVKINTPACAEGHANESQISLSFTD